MGATLDDARCAQGRAERTGGAPGARELELLRRKPAGLVSLAELEHGDGGWRAPSHEGRVASSELIGAATRFEQVLRAACQIALQHAQARPDVGCKEQARIIGQGLTETGAVECGRGLIEPALLHECL